MIHFRATCMSALLLTLAAVTAAYADGPGAYRPKASAPSVLLEERAIDAYNLGYAAIQSADHLIALTEATSDSNERQQTQRSARVSYEKALKHFEQAVRIDPSLYEAFTYLGYANRRLGRYPQALAAYEQALKLNAEYSYAIEYQGEAFLGLNRVDDMRFSYLRLYALDKAQAKKLLLAMQRWLKHSPPGMDTTDFAAWVEERAAQTRDDLAALPW